LSEKSPSVPFSPLPFSMTAINRLDYSLLGWGETEVDYMVILSQHNRFSLYLDMTDDG
jgi:hypothetical protein